MAFKINVSDKGKTLKIETESESLIQNKIGDTIKGESFSPDLEGYELKITGTSDASGFPGIQGQTGGHLRKLLLTKADKGMNNRTKGLRLKKTVRGEEITEKTSQINMVVVKEGKKKFATLIPKKGEDKKEEAPAAEKPAEEKPAEPKPEAAAQDTEPKETEEKPAEKPVEEKTEVQPPAAKEKTEELPEKETITEEAQPDQEPKASEPEKKELAEPDKEKTE